MRLSFAREYAWHTDLENLENTIGAANGTCNPKRIGPPTQPPMILLPRPGFLGFRFMTVA